MKSARLVNIELTPSGQYQVWYWRNRWAKTTKTFDSYADAFTFAAMKGKVRCLKSSPTSSPS